jgi:SNF family Na+-dependent transporter
VFLGKAASLEGSSNGIEEYIGKWDVSILTERGEVWAIAVSQIFFSIGVVSFCGKSVCDFELDTFANYMVCVFAFCRLLVS